MPTPRPTPSPMMVEECFDDAVLGFGADVSVDVGVNVGFEALEAVADVVAEAEPVVTEENDATRELISESFIDAVLHRSACSLHQLAVSVLTGNAAISLSVELSCKATYWSFCLRSSHPVSGILSIIESQTCVAQFVLSPQLSG
jgi:hypothetical protein